MDPQIIESLSTFLSDLDTVGLAGLIALALVIWAWKGPFKTIQNSVTEIKDNHLHELPELVENSRRTVDVLQRIEVKLGENFASINARLDGKQQ